MGQIERIRPVSSFVEPLLRDATSMTELMKLRETASAAGTETVRPT
jgi:hypothetical protein